MNPRFARVRPDVTVDEAISYLRHQSANVETIYYAYALSDAQQLLGVVSFRELFAADRQKLVRDVMKTGLIAATEEMDQEAVAKLVTDHNRSPFRFSIATADCKGSLEWTTSLMWFQKKRAKTFRKLAGPNPCMLPIWKSDFGR